MAGAFDPYSVPEQGNPPVVRALKIGAFEKLGVPRTLFDVSRVLVIDTAVSPSEKILALSAAPRSSTSGSSEMIGASGSNCGLFKSVPAAVHSASVIGESGTLTPR